MSDQPPPPENRRNPDYAPPQHPGGYAPPPAGYGPSGPRAGFWARFGAYLLDGLIIGIIPGIVIAIGFANSNLNTYQVGNRVEFKSGSLSPLVGLGYVLYAVVSIAYFVYFEGGSTGQTLGKKALGIRVVDDKTGGPIGYGRAFIRWLGRIVSSIVCSLGYLWMLWDGEKQTWHDKFASDFVVPVEAYPLR